MIHSQKQKEKQHKSLPIRSHSDIPDTHNKAIRYISKIVDRDFYYVRNVINGFFGKWGIKYFVERTIPVNIRNLGHFYFPKKVINDKAKLLELKKNASNVGTRQRMRKSRAKQRLYFL